MVGEFVASSVLGGMFYEAVKGGLKQSRAFLESKGFLEKDVTAILEEIDEQKPFHSQEAFEVYVSNSKRIQEAINNISTTQNNNIETNNGAVVQNNSGNMTIDNSKTVHNYTNEKKNDKYLTAIAQEEEFLHREEDLEDIKVKLSSKKSLLLCGIGGIGKTALAKKYLSLNENNYKCLAYVECKKGLESALLTEFDKKVEEGQTQEEALKKLFKELSNYEPLNLLVLDDIEKEDFEKALKWKLGNFHIILTSRNKYGHYKEINEMSEKDITDIFFTFYTKEEKQTITKLLEHLNFHTGFVKLTAQTMQTSNILDIKTMISKFEKGELTTVRTDEDKTFNTYLQELFTLQNLEQPLITLLQQLSFLPAIELSFQEIELYLNKEKTREELDINLQKLHKQGWLQQTTSRTYKLHQIIQTFLETNHKLSFKEIEPHITHYTKLLKIQHHESGIIKEKYLPFAKALLKYTKDEKQKGVAIFANNISAIFKALGKLEEALKYQQQATIIKECILDKNHSHLAISYNNFSTILQDLGRLEEALAYQKKALKIRESVLDKKHPSLATGYNNLSMILQDLGRLEEALAYQKKAVEIRESVLDKKHLSLATSYNNLSMILKALGRLEEAFEYQKKAIEIYESVFDKYHPSLAASYNNLSGILQDLGRLEKALAYQEKTLEIVESVLDKKHPDLAMSYNNLSTILKTLGRLEEALAYQQKALTIRESVLNKKHPDLATSYNNLSVILQALGRLEEALLYQKKAVEIQESIFEKHHPHLQVAYKNLSIIQKKIEASVS